MAGFFSDLGGERYSMSISLDNKLVVAVASSALFDLSESDAVFQAAVAGRDIQPYVDHMREHEEVPFPKGAAFPFIRRLLLIKDRFPDDLIEVVFLSRNSADTGLRVMNTIQHYGLDITRGAFLDGDAPWPYMKSFNAALFLSGNDADVREANRLLLPAGKIGATEYRDTEDDKTLRIAFDFDGVLADDQSETIYQTQGLAGFQDHETARKEIPHPPGPLKPLLEKLRGLQDFENALWKEDPSFEPKIKTAIVTARGAPAHERAIKTLRHWGLDGDKAFFLGGMTKEAVLSEFMPHIFFDDQIGHLTDLFPSVHIPFGDLNRREVGEEGMPTGLEETKEIGRPTEDGKPAPEIVASASTAPQSPSVQTAGKSTLNEPQEHLIKRSPDLAKKGVLTPAKGPRSYTQSAVNRRPPGWKAKAGERIWVAEVGYGIYAGGKLLTDPTMLSFSSIEDLLDRTDEIPVQDDPYILALIRQIHRAKNFKALNVLIVETEVFDLGSVIEIPKELRTQGSWYYLDPGQIDQSKAGSSLTLSPNIPGAVRLRVYQRLVKEVDRHIIDIDHFVPKAVGGPGNIEENLVPLSFSLNRAKSARIPSGLFDVAAGSPDVSALVPREFSGGEARFLPEAGARDAAKKIVAAVNQWDDLSDVRAFYKAVVDHHFNV